MNLIVLGERKSEWQPHVVPSFQRQVPANALLTGPRYKKSTLPLLCGGCRRSVNS